MKIEQLKLENFKCFKTEKTFDFGQLTILTGANSSGKSTVMQALLSIIQSNDFPLSYSPNGKYVHLGDFNNLTHHGNENPIKFTLKTIENQTVITCKTSWLKNPRTLLPYLQQLSVQGQQLLTVEFKEKDSYILKEKDSVGTEVNIYVNRSELLFRVRQIFKFNDFLQGTFKYMSAFRQQPFRTYIEKNNYKFEMGNNGDGYIDQILDWEKYSDDKLQKLTDILKQLKLLKALKMKRLNGGRFEILVKTTPYSTWTPLSNVGSGVGQLLPILVADLQTSETINGRFDVQTEYNNPSTFLIEEPETHLHPSVQSKLAEYMIGNIQKTDKNYVIETHSEYFLNRIRLAIVKGELKPSDLKVYFLQNIADDTTVYDVQFALNGAIKNAPKSFFETYSMDVMQIALNS
jgi:predicted ATPase